MPIAVNAPPQKQKEDVMGTILKGLQIAGAAFKIPEAIESYKQLTFKGSTEGRAQEQGLIRVPDQDISGTEQTIVSAAADSDIDQMRMEKRAALMPNQDKPLIPKDASKKESPLMPRKYASERTLDIDGQKVRFYSPALEKEAEASAEKLRKEFKGTSQIQILDQAAENYTNVESGLKQGGHAGHMVALNNLAKLASPGPVRFNSDGTMISEGGGLMDEVTKRFNFLVKNKNVAIDAGDIKGVRDISRTLMQNYIDRASPEIEKFKATAQSQGVSEDRLHLPDYSNLVQKEEAKPITQAKPVKSATQKQEENIKSGRARALKLLGK